LRCFGHVEYKMMLYDGDRRKYTGRLGWTDSVKNLRKSESFGLSQEDA